MWWSLPLILLVGWVSFRYSDIEHASALHSVVLPLLCLFSVIALVLWLGLFMSRLDGGRRRYSNSADYGAASDPDSGCGGD